MLIIDVSILDISIQFAKLHFFYAINKYFLSFFVENFVYTLHYTS